MKEDGSLLESLAQEEMRADSGQPCVQIAMRGRTDERYRKVNEEK